MEKTPEQQKPPEQEPQEPAEQPAEGSGSAGVPPNELQEFAAFVQTYLTPILWAGAIALAVILAIWGYRAHVRSGREKVAEQLFAAVPLDALERTAKQNASAPATPLLLLRIAKAHYVSGNYTMALSKYDEFMKRFPGHLMAGTADMGRSSCLEAMGRYAEALRGYETFRAANTNHYLVAHTVLGQGRCLQHLGRRDEARTVCEDYLAAHPDTPWKFLLEEAITRARETNDVVAAAASTNLFVIPQPVPAQ